MTQLEPAATANLETLRRRAHGPVLLPGDEGYDAERTGFQLADPHRPDVIVGATSRDDVHAAVEFAAANGSPVAVQATGHGLPMAANGGLLISTARMNGVRVDPASRSAWLDAGVRWQQGMDAAAPHGLAPLSGSAPQVGAVSYTLGGGIGLLARRYGYAADHVRRIEVVTAEGGTARLRQVSAEQEPELFWALRGGRNNFGVVTGLEIGLVPVGTIYGGGLYFDAELVPEVLRTYREWTGTVPDEMTSSVAMIPFPDAPGAPEPLRGRHIAHVRIAFAGTAEAGERLVAPLRAIGPRLIDTVGEMPYTASGTIHNEPPDPMAYHATHALLYELDASTVSAILELAGPGAAEVCVVELRHLGAALAAEPSVPSAVGRRDAQFVVGLVSPLTGAADDAARRFHQRFLAAVAPRDAGRSLNFLYGENAAPQQVRAAYEPDDYRRLTELKAGYDPTNIFRHNHNIPPRDGG